MTIEQAVQAYIKAFGNTPRTKDMALKNEQKVRHALTAALPFLPVQGAVNIDEIVQPLEDIHAPGGRCHWTDVATAIGEVRRALSALEPSAARDLALEEAAQVIDAKAEEHEKEARDLRGSDRDRRFCSAVAVRLRGSANEIRALSSPDHADARKFRIGDRVTKTKGSSWTGRIVGFYSTKLTPVGYAVESETEIGSVQIYPEAALSSAPSGGDRHGE